MFIAIDIGNTNTGIAVIDVETQNFASLQKPKIIRVESVRTGIRGCYEKRLSKALRALVSSELRAQSSELTKVIICSVVPKATAIAARCAKKVFKATPKIVGKDIMVPIRNKYGEPEQVGQDRLVCAYAAVELYGAPAVVVDLGTAMTFDVVSVKKEYLGGMIVPGIRLSAEALFEKTALLPKIDIHKPKRLIGKTTEQSMLSGIFYGYGEMIKGLIDLLSKDLKTKPKIIVTGGYSDLMKHYVLDDACVVDKELIFKGIALLKE
jgi:type III pantothenate kinase